MTTHLMRHTLRPLCLSLPSKPPQITTTTTTPLRLHLPHLHQFRLQSTTPAPSPSPTPTGKSSILAAAAGKAPGAKPIVPASEIPLSARAVEKRVPLPPFTPAVPAVDVPVDAHMPVKTIAQTQAQTQTVSSPPSPPPPSPGDRTLRVKILERLGPLAEVIKAYGREQRKRPWITQIWTALVIYFAADISAQNISGKEYDPERTMRSLIIGLGIAIPGYEWLIFLGNHFNYRSLYFSLAVKCIVAQSFYTPLYNTYFFGMQALLAGNSWDEIIERIKATVPTSSINSCKVWPIITAFSFAFLPSEYRNAFNGLIAIFWQTYLSFLNRRAEEAAEVVGKAHHGLHVAEAVKGVVKEGVKQVEVVAHIQ